MGFLTEFKNKLHILKLKKCQVLLPETLKSIMAPRSIRSLTATKSSRRHATINGVKPWHNVQLKTRINQLLNPCTLEKFYPFVQIPKYD